MFFTQSLDARITPRIAYGPVRFGVDAFWGSALSECCCFCYNINCPGAKIQEMPWAMGTPKSPEHFSRSMTFGVSKGMGHAQWQQEFPKTLRICNDICNSSNFPRNRVYAKVMEKLEFVNKCQHHCLGL
jgi:hypothetical protein